MSSQILEIVECIRELSEDATLPKNVKQKIDSIIDILNNGGSSISMQVSKAIHELEDLVEDKNLESYSRTQLYNIMSRLETV